MSISISESTQSTNESGSFHSSQYEQLDDESGVFSQAPHGKASSTLLGQRYADDGSTTNSSVTGRLRNEGSSSTLRSYYDRQKSPLSISQQTSNSSARDLALRKGYPPIIQRSPLLQVESVDPFGQQFAGRQIRVDDKDPNAGALSERNSRKKPARLDLSMLFPSRKHSKKSERETMAQSPSSTSTNLSRGQESQSGSGSGRRRLTKVSSKESLQSQKFSIRSAQSEGQRQRQTSGTLDQLYDHYESMPPRSARMDRIPESSVPDRDEIKISGNDQQLRVKSTSRSANNRESYLSPSNSETFSWRHVRESMISPPLESSSAASFSSRNTRTSRRTSTSVLSNSDLKQRSVLSLSSDSEDDSESELVRSPRVPSQDNKALRMLNGSSSLPKEDRSHQKQQPEGSIARHHGQRKGLAKGTPFLTIPESSIPTLPITRSWQATKVETETQKNGQSSNQKEKRSTKKGLGSSIGSGPSSYQEPTPPLSPTSVEFRQSSSRSSRFMAVTKQEEALLEALRQKRARMREKIIEEHETAKSPPRIPERVASRYSTTSTVSTVRGERGSNEKQKVLLYLDTPISESQAIDTAEPSPDLSDFLSFGSDEDSTPRTSPPKGQARPDSAVSPHSRGSKFSPMTPPSAARLSAVGAIAGFKDVRGIEQELGGKKRLNGVRFVEDTKVVNSQDFLLDENESEVIWGL